MLTAGRKKRGFFSAVPGNWRTPRWHGLPTRHLTFKTGMVSTQESLRQAHQPTAKSKEGKSKEDWRQASTATPPP
jgi:hypothetical protein